MWTARPSSPRCIFTDYKWFSLGVTVSGPLFDFICLPFCSSASYPVVSVCGLSGFKNKWEIEWLTLSIKDVLKHYNICSKLVSKAIHSSVKLAWCGLQFDFDSKVWSCRRINSSVFYCTLSEETFLTQWQQNRDSFTMQMVGYKHTH